MIERVVVTGASSGIGAACVDAFRGLGAESIGIDIATSSRADDHLELDLADSSCGVALARHVGGRAVDVLVNCAAISMSLPALETGADEFDRVIAINLRAPFLLASGIHQSLRSRSGAVVNVASVHALATSSPVSVYAASKGGLVAMTRALALEWAPDVRVNCVLPGAVDTPMLVDGLERAGRDINSFGAAQAAGRVGRPEEVADAVVFMASNRYVTGASLIVDGGATARLSTE
jgi:NAD(P)-dependent dehydrogenase (short-subunit alcohol dehydrogenase family)